MGAHVILEHLYSISHFALHSKDKKILQSSAVNLMEKKLLLILYLPTAQFKGVTNQPITAQRTRSVIHPIFLLKLLQ